MPGTSLPITLTQEQVTYFATPNVREFTPERSTVFGVFAEDGLTYYGIPVYGEVAVKAGLDGAGPVVTPQTRTDAADPRRVAQVRGFLERYLPGALGPELSTRVCCYGPRRRQPFPVSAFRAGRPGWDAGPGVTAG